MTARAGHQLNPERARPGRVGSPWWHSVLGSQSSARSLANPISSSFAPLARGKPNEAFSIERLPSGSFRIE